MDIKMEFKKSKILEVLKIEPYDVFKIYRPDTPDVLDNCYFNESGFLFKENVFFDDYLTLVEIINGNYRLIFEKEKWCDDDIDVIFKLKRYIESLPGELEKAYLKYNYNNLVWNLIIVPIESIRELYQEKDLKIPLSLSRKNKCNIPFYKVLKEIQAQKNE